MNYARTAILIAAMTALFLVVGGLLGGEMGMLIAFGFAVVTNLFAYWNADKLVLRMYGAREVGPAEAPQFHAIVQRLATRAGLPMPKVYVIDGDQPNAFATGRNPQNAAVAASTGLLAMLDAREIAGVMAHELAHVKHRDTLIMTITATLAGAIGMLAQFGMFFGSGSRDSSGRSNPLGIVGVILAMIVAPLAAALVQMAISRGREYQADAGGAEISGDPEALASALAKISDAAHAIPNRQAEANPATAHLFIVNPLAGGVRDGMFSTHPATENRIARLMEMVESRGGRLRGRPNAAPSAAQAPRRGPWG